MLTFLTLVFFGSVEARFCPEFICGKKQTFRAVRQLRGYKDLSTKQMRKLLESEQAILIFDARTEEQDDGRRIGKAKRLPYNTPDEEIQTAVPKDAVIVVYCTHAKCLTSRYLAESMVRLGYPNVYRYPDGLEGWTNAKQPVAMVDPRKSR